jgi:predicted Rossmann fold flavoprotein
MVGSQTARIAAEQTLHALNFAGTYTAGVIEKVDIAVIGAGAAGLMAGIWAGRTSQESRQSRRIVLLDGAKHLGAKILVAGGGRCNVTHDVVSEQAFAGSSRNAIKKVLRRFDVPVTIDFFRQLGVELKREETGKLFPTTDKARTVLDALLDAVRAAGAEILNPWRVERISKQDDGTFEVKGVGQGTTLHAAKIVLATGGKALPKTGSDGHAYGIAKALGHSISERVFPALVPLTLPRDHFICGLSGLSAIVTLEVRSGTGKRMMSFTDSMLCAHFGISGPVALDISRYLGEAKAGDPAAQLWINWLPESSLEKLDADLVQLGRVSPGRMLRERGLPQRLAEGLCGQAEVDPSAPAHALTREKRRTLAAAITQMNLPVTGDRGFVHAEVTAGGIPLTEIRLETMQSRICPGLFICGEICDVDGRIGGYNFQWAWASGYLAGGAAAVEH